MKHHFYSTSVGGEGGISPIDFYGFGEALLG
jgi:hypothetical protein